MTDWQQGGEDVRKALMENVNPNKTDALKTIGDKLLFVSTDLKAIFRMVAPIGSGIVSIDNAPKMVAEADNATASYKYANVRKQLTDIKLLIEEWNDDYAKMLKSPTFYYVDAKIVNNKIDGVSSSVNVVNLSISDETWFYLPQGNTLTNYKLTQIAYRDFINAVLAYYARTDKVHELTKGLSVEKCVKKAPEITNLLKDKPDVIKSLEGFELPE